MVVRGRRAGGSGGGGGGGRLGVLAGLAGALPLLHEVEELQGALPLAVGALGAAPLVAPLAAEVVLAADGDAGPQPLHDGAVHPGRRRAPPQQPGPQPRGLGGSRVAHRWLPVLALRMGRSSLPHGGGRGGMGGEAGAAAGARARGLATGRRAVSPAPPAHPRPAPGR